MASLLSKKNDLQSFPRVISQKAGVSSSLSQKEFDDGGCFWVFFLFSKKMIKSNYELVCTQPELRRKVDVFLAFLLLDFLKHHQPFLGPHHLSSGFFIPSFFECITGFPSSFVMVISWSSGSFCHEGFGQQHCIDSSELMMVSATENVGTRTMLLHL